MKEHNMSSPPKTDVVIARKPEDRAKITERLLNYAKNDGIKITLITTNGVNLKGTVDAFDGESVLIHYKDPKGAREDKTSLVKLSRVISIIIPEEDRAYVYGKLAQEGFDVVIDE